MILSQLIREIESLSKPAKAIFLQKYFRTAKGDYGEGDIFIGLTVPQSRQLARKYKDLTQTEIKELLKSPIHEHRQIALMLLEHKFIKSSEEQRKSIYNFYLKSTKYINNWDLVDGSAPTIVGIYLKDKPRDDLIKLAHSSNLWERRIAIVSTYTFIKLDDFDFTLLISKLLFQDKHDLIHKAVGWMLREVGKRSEKTLKQFLDINGSQMPRTTLRYAIERFSEDTRRHYLESSRNNK